MCKFTDNEKYSVLIFWKRAVAFAAGNDHMHSWISRRHLKPSHDSFHQKCSITGIHHINTPRFFSISQYKLKLNFCFNLNLYRRIWVARIREFRGCGIFGGNWRMQCWISIPHCQIQLWNCHPKLSCKVWNSRPKLWYTFAELSPNTAMHSCETVTQNCHVHFDRKNPPLPRGFSIYYVPSSRTVCKRTPLEGFVPDSWRGVLLFTVFDEGT